MKTFTLIILGLVNSILLTPFVLSFIFTLAVIWTFTLNGVVPIPQFIIPSGQYNGGDVMRAFGLLSFIIAAIFSIIETFTNKKFEVRNRVKYSFYAILLTIWYSIVAYFFIAKTEMTVTEVSLIVATLYIIALVSIFLRAVFSKVIQKVNSLEFNN